jgi:hypothetical protein
MADAFFERGGGNLESGMTRPWFGSGAMAFWLALAVAVCSAEDRIVPGDFVAERPTLACLGFRWYVNGDDNRDARVNVAYRQKGATGWKTALPLLRIKGEVSGQGDHEIEWTAPNLFAGSIFDLAPNRDYEVSLTLDDPDGGHAEKSITLKTRGEPAAFEKGQTLHVYPSAETGARQVPAFTGLMSAYAVVQPGDIILVHKGTYAVPDSSKQERTDYVLNKSGTSEKPIVIRAAGDGEVIFDGGGALKLIDCQQAHHHHLEGLTLCNADHLVYAGRERGCTGLVVRRCRLEDAGYPIFGLHPECRDFYIADNVLIGPHREWHPRTGKENDSHAVWLSGQGHVVCHNRISQFWDGINVYGRRPPENRDLQNCAIDFYNNDISKCSDDGIELDFGVHNIRVFRNRIANVFMGISVQPVYGGPAYIFRNVVYNSTRSPLKPNQHPAGLLIFNNTFLAHGSAGRLAPMWQNTQIHNNLFLGTDGGPGVIWTGTPTPETSRLDYNGWHFFAGSEKYPIWWKFARPTRVPTSSQPSTEGVFRDLREFTRYTGYESHGIAVSYHDFEKSVPPTGIDQPLPELDLRLKPGSNAIDAGLALPNITAGFIGNGPDLGAFELGQPLPHYGPRQ